jgi:threonine dehydrogenase-like Zn-dependent dehydrogenase
MCQGRRTNYCERLALVETLGIGAHAVERCGLKAGETALVIGAGPIGLSTAVFAEIAKAEVVLAEIDESRRAFAESLGLRTVDVADDLQRDVVFDATGNAAQWQGV